MTVRAVQFTAPRRIDLVPVNVPDPPPPGTLLAETLYSGISGGTEMLAYRGELDVSLPLDETLGMAGTFRYPFRYGYSCVGRVLRGGGDVPVGSLVFAYHPHQERLAVPEADVVVVAGPGGTDVDPRLATLFPLVETALQLTLDAGPLLTDTVVVTGLGPVGILTALLLRRAGADVVGSEPHAWRRDVAAAVGVDAVTPEDLPAVVDRRTAGRGSPLLIEVSGAPQALRDGLGLLSHEGTALVGSWYGTREVTLPLGGDFHRRRLTIRSSQVSTVPAAMAPRWDVKRRREAARSLLSELPLAALATTEFPVEDAAAAFAVVDRGRPGVVHVALRYH